MHENVERRIPCFRTGFFFHVFVVPCFVGQRRQRDNLGDKKIRKKEREGEGALGLWTPTLKCLHVRKGINLSLLFFFFSKGTVIILPWPVGTQVHPKFSAKQSAFLSGSLAEKGLLLSACIPPSCLVFRLVIFL